MFELNPGVLEFSFQKNLMHVRGAVVFRRLFSQLVAVKLIQHY